MSLEYFARDGRPLDFASWAELTGQPEYVHVARTEIGRYLVSTVWIGISFLPSEPPLLFETMVFSGAYDCPYTQARSATLAEAEDFHHEMCEVIRATLAEAG